VETEYLDEEQVIALYNKVRTGKRTWPSGIWTSLLEESNIAPAPHLSIDHFP